MQKIIPEDIDAILPQTQCGLCGHGGCMPYAEALIFEGAEINLCPPGGIQTLNKLGNLLNRDPSPHEAQMRAEAKPGLLAIVREDECIGCTKCIQACPVDAILGAAKEMHTVISDECTGCELCIPPCPVDCIDLVKTTPAKLAITEQTAAELQTADRYRKRYLAREERLAEEKKLKSEKKLKRSVSEKKTYIEQALQRAKAKKKSQTA
jgi:electron transport complex protein RnfB